VKKRELERHLATHGCRLARQAAKHEFWENPPTGQRTTVPRHREIKPATARGIRHATANRIPLSETTSPRSPAFGVAAWLLWVSSTDRAHALTQRSPMPAANSRAIPASSHAERALRTSWGCEGRRAARLTVCQRSLT